MSIIDRINIFKLFRYNKKEVSLQEAIDIINEHGKSVAVIDVRSIQEYNEGHLEGAINIPIYDIKKIKDIIKDRNSIIIVYCSNGIRSKKAAKILNDLCYLNVYSINKGVNI